MIKQIKFITIAVLFSPLFAKAQEGSTLIGYIFDSQTGLPLPNIYVECDDTTKSIITEPSGRFRFDSLAYGKHKLSIIDENKNYIMVDSIVFLTKDSIKQVNITMLINVEKRCSFYREMAKNDIKQQKIKLFIYESHLKSPKNDIHFEQKYQVEYKKDYEGCMYFPTDCLKEYNKTIAEYLTKIYGKRWKKKVRKDVIF